MQYYLITEVGGTIWRKVKIEFCVYEYFFLLLFSSSSSSSFYYNILLGMHHSQMT